MARVNKNQPVDSMFAYNVAKDIVDLERKINELKINQPKSQSIEFGKGYVVANNSIYREVLNSNVAMIQTGYMLSNDLWFGDRPNDGIWYNPINGERYNRKNGIDEKLFTPDFDLSTLQNYITTENAYSYYGKLPIYDGEKGTGSLVIQLSFTIPTTFNPKSIPELKIRIKGYDETNVLSKQVEDNIYLTVEFYSDVNLSEGTETFEVELLDDKSNVLYTNSHTVEFADVDSAIKNAKFEFVEPKEIGNRFIVPVPTIQTGGNNDNVKPSFIMRKVEYRLNGKVQRGIIQDPHEPYIFSADTAEELKGPVEVWYKGERIK